MTTDRRPPRTRRGTANPPLPTMRSERRWRRRRLFGRRRRFRFDRRTV